MQTRLRFPFTGALTCATGLLLGSVSFAQTPAATLAPTGTLRAFFSA